MSYQMERGSTEALRSGSSSHTRAGDEHCLLLVGVMEREGENAKGKGKGERERGERERGGRKGRGQREERKVWRP